MKDDFDYQQVPQTFTHCLRAVCPFSDDCLRFEAALHADAEKAYFLAVNPAYVTGKENCPYYLPNRMSRFVLGITHLFDNMPHHKAVKIRKALFNHIGRNKFYRIRLKQRYITPAEQAYIGELFRSEGINEEPVYDEYSYKYDFYTD